MLLIEPHFSHSNILWYRSILCFSIVSLWNHRLSELIEFDMSTHIFIFIPDILDLNGKVAGYLSGYHKKTESTESYYIVSTTVTKYSPNIIGYIGRNCKHLKNFENVKLFINTANSKLNIIGDNRVNAVVEIFYDFNSFKNSNVIHCKSENYGEHFEFLTDELRKCNENGLKNGRRLFVAIFATIILLIDIFLRVSKIKVYLSVRLIICKILDKLKICLSYSETYIYFVDRVAKLKWFFTTLQQEKWLTPKLGNILVASILDVLIGFILYNWFLKHEAEVVVLLQATLEVKMLCGNFNPVLLY